ncbi:MAG: pyruvate:ferredoxin (flavodoxin) oxidoreductase [Planctomycetota bacterium]|jgi:pyruvate-ferredoxin/flavodoxin oxidoreductase
MSGKVIITDGNTAAAYVAHATNDVCAIYPITPSSVMGEVADERTAKGLRNIWGTLPNVTEMQSEAGAAAAVHGALTTGALTSTFTASQGLLLMIPSMFKIAGELCPTVFHVSARAVACQALSIFGDHSDVMSVRSTGFGLIATGNVQEVMDIALITQAASIESRIPFVHFFDGFRTSHEVQKVHELSFDDMRAMLEDDLVRAHRERGMCPDRPVLRGTSQNPDVYFQGRETVNPFVNQVPEIMTRQMEKFGQLFGRHYKLFDYVGDPEADRVIIMMGSGAECMHETVENLMKQGEKVGLVKVRLYRPFSTKDFVEALPPTAKTIGVLDRTKEPGAIGEPLYVDVRTAIGEAMSEGWYKGSGYPVVVGGRYGLGSKEFTPAMAKAALDNLKEKKPKNHFTVGITDDVTFTSLEVDEDYENDQAGVVCGKFFGLGADGTVGANKNSIKIIGENTDYEAQGYFVYDSKKAGAITVSHLRFGKNTIRSPYLVKSADFIAVHHFSFLERYDVLEGVKEGGSFLLNAPFKHDEVWDKMPRKVQQTIIDKKLKFYTIDAVTLGKELGLGARINIIMQTAFFDIANIIPREQFTEAIADSVRKTYGGKGEKVVNMNVSAMHAALENLHEVAVPGQATSDIEMAHLVPEDSPAFVREVVEPIMATKGDEIPVSKMPSDGTFPVATTQFEKRNIAVDIPEWDSKSCLQCGLCSYVCPHAAIRLKVYEPDVLKDAPGTFQSVKAKGVKDKEMNFTVQVAPEDCTGCAACVHTCPGKRKDAEGNRTGEKTLKMVFQYDVREQERENYKFFLENIPETDINLFKQSTIKGSQLIRPLFEYSGACAGCGETPYVKLLSQLFGDRLMIGNATGCSSIYGGNLPTTPYCVRDDGRGPTWSNSLFEDAAEFSFGMRLAVDRFMESGHDLMAGMIEKGSPHANLMREIMEAPQKTLAEIEEQRKRVVSLREAIKGDDSFEAKRLVELSDYLVAKSIWAMGGDGWAYDIGYGGLDHVMASGKNINAIVLDTEVYSNTGGQMSKATPAAATAKFAEGGKPMPKKDLAMMLMSYGNVYVARVAFGANPAQAIKAFIEAEAYDGPSCVICYSHCIAHGINMTTGVDQQKKAVNSGHWVLMRYNPDLVKEDKNPLQLDSKAPSIPFRDFAYSETRFRRLKILSEEQAEKMMEVAETSTAQRAHLYQMMAKMDYGEDGEEEKAEEKKTEKKKV